MKQGYVFLPINAQGTGAAGDVSMSYPVGICFKAAGCPTTLKAPATVWNYAQTGSPIAVEVTHEGAAAAASHYMDTAYGLDSTNTATVTNAFMQVRGNCVSFFIICLVLTYKSPSHAQVVHGTLYHMNLESSDATTHTVSVHQDLSGNLSVVSAVVSPSGPNVGAIVGGVVGTVAVIGIVAVVAFVIIRRRRRSIRFQQQQQLSIEQGDGSILNEPLLTAE